jgi:hypothetical protein
MVDAVDLLIDHELSHEQSHGKEHEIEPGQYPEYLVCQDLLEFNF